MVELGLTPAARSRVMADAPIATQYAVSPVPLRIERVIVDPAGNRRTYDPAEAEAWARKHCDEA